MRDSQEEELGGADMELNRKILKYGLVIIVLSVVVNGIFSWSITLEQPVFMKMYIEKSILQYSDKYVRDTIELKYLTNLSDKRKITGIEFPNEPHVYVDVMHGSNLWNPFSSLNNRQETLKGKRVGRYYLRTANLYLYLEDIGEEWDEIELSTAQIEFDDGTTMLADLGKILIYNREEREKIIESRHTSRSSDGTGFLSANVIKDIKLLDIEDSIFDNPKDYYSLFIGDKEQGEFKGISFDYGDTIELRFKINKSMTSVDNFTYFDVRPKLFYEDNEGNIAYIRSHNISYEPRYFSFINLLRYLRARGEI